MRVLPFLCVSQWPSAECCQQLVLGVSQVGDHDQNSTVLRDAQAQSSVGGVTVLIEQVIQSSQGLDGLLILVVGVVQVNESSLGDIDVLDLLCRPS